MEYEFVSPPFLEGQSADEIHRRMLERLPEDLDRSEGGFPWDFTRPTADEVAEYVSYALTNAIRGIFARFCDPFLLDYHADRNGMKRRAAEPARAVVKLSGKEGTEIPAGFAVSTEAAYDRPSVTFLTDEAVTLGTQPVSVTVTAAEPGAEGNVGAGAISIVDTPVKGLASITNPSAAFGGIDEESDEDLRARIVEYEQTQGVSFVGSYADYKRWALEVQGVGSVQVQGGEDGDCTVKLILTGSDGAPASEELCQAVHDHIMRPDDPSQRLAGVCDLLTVTPPATLTVSVAATVELDGTALLEDIQAELRLRLEQYYQGEAADAGEIRYTRVGAILLSCGGVADYDPGTLRLNGGTANLPIAAGQLPVTRREDITLVEGTVA